jgi:hypothetical protein
VFGLCPLQSERELDRVWFAPDIDIHLTCPTRRFVVAPDSQRPLWKTLAHKMAFLRYIVSPPLAKLTRGMDSTPARKAERMNVLGPVTLYPDQHCWPG